MDSSHNDNASHLSPDYPVNPTSPPDLIPEHTVQPDYSDTSLTDIDQTPLYVAINETVRDDATSQPLDLSVGSNASFGITSDSSAYNYQTVEQAIPVIPNPNDCSPSQTDITSDNIEDSVAAYVSTILANAVAILESESNSTTVNQPTSTGSSSSLDATDSLSQEKPSLSISIDMVQTEETVPGSSRPNTNSCRPIQNELDMDAVTSADITAYVAGILANAIDILEAEEEPEVVPTPSPPQSHFCRHVFIEQ